MCHSYKKSLKIFSRYLSAVCIIKKNFLVGKKSKNKTKQNQKLYINLFLIGILLRWGFLIWELIFIYCGLLVLILVVFFSFFCVLFFLSLRFGQISPLAFFTWCGRQQLWKALITGDTVTRLSIPIRGRSKSPEEGQRWNLAET